MTTVGELAAMPPGVAGALPRDRPPDGTCPNCPGASTTDRWCPSRRPSRSATRRRSPPTCGTSDELQRPAPADGGRIGHRPARAERAARTVTVKLRFGDFTQITRSHTLDGPVDATPAIGAVAAALLDSVDLSRGVRLLGREPVRVWPSRVRGPSCAWTSTRRPADARRRGAAPGRDGGRRPSGGTGPTVPGRPREAERLQQSWGSVTGAVDAIRARYGGEAVGPASLVTPEGIGCASGARPSGAVAPGGATRTPEPDREPPGPDGAGAGRPTGTAPAPGPSRRRGADLNTCVRDREGIA